MTRVPLTMTCFMPSESRRGSWNVAFSVTVSGSNTTMSASMPSWMRPFFFICGAAVSRMLHAFSEQCRIASIQLSIGRSRTHLRRNRV